MQKINYTNIQNEVKRLHQEIWRNKESLWPGQSLLPIDMLNPEVVCRILGIEYLELNDLESQVFSFRGSKFKVAGLIDRQANKIVVSNAFPKNISRFTAAHEIGHWMLHPNQVMHRDRSIDGSNAMNTSRPIEEREADYFAACFLMPARLVTEMFQQVFMTTIPMRFDDNVSFWVNPNEHESLLRTGENSLNREFSLARCTSFNSRHFYSLADQFRVSNAAMAIRIKELKLVGWP